ncbi:MAG: tRNA pseudouridine(38-40) synthase TruA [Cetobacterium sp.]
MRTVQGEIEKALKVVLKEEINLVSAGRTDRGVHSKHQVSNFFTNSSIPVHRLERVLNGLLPIDINIFLVEEKDEAFSARFSARHRAYEYDITSEKTTFKRRYATYYPEKIDCKKFLEILNPLLGEHDFANFRLSDCCSRTTNREIHEIKCYNTSETDVRVYIRGNAFLKSQIRIIVGTALSIYSKKTDENQLKDMLNNPEVYYPKIVAEPQGLYLCEIGY